MQRGVIAALLRPRCGLVAASLRPCCGLVAASLRPCCGLVAALLRPRCGLVAALLRPRCGGLVAEAPSCSHGRSFGGLIATVRIAGAAVPPRSSRHSIAVTAESLIAVQTALTAKKVGRVAAVLRPYCGRIAGAVSLAYRGRIAVAANAAARQQTPRRLRHSVYETGGYHEVERETERECGRRNEGEWAAE